MNAAEWGKEAAIRVLAFQVRRVLELKHSGRSLDSAEDREVVADDLAKFMFDQIVKHSQKRPSNG